MHPVDRTRSQRFSKHLSTSHEQHCCYSRLMRLVLGALLVSYMPLGCHTKLLPCRPLIVRLGQGRSCICSRTNSTCDAGISGWLVSVEIIAQHTCHSRPLAPVNEQFVPQPWEL